MPKQPISAQFYSYNKNKGRTPCFIHFSDGLPTFEGRLKNMWDSMDLVIILPSNNTNNKM
ncbi:hypothetical protein HMPREF3107_01765 [Neisseria sp. HMSC31F04]|nr:hypothetical protein HMPREF3107_01765 [Neisseria sp. HMSC31F04]